MSKETAVRLTRAKSFKTAMLLAFILLMLSAPYEAFAAPIFQEDFESGNFSKFTFVWRDGQGESAEAGDGQCITNGGEVRGVCKPSTIAHSGKRSFQDHYVMTSAGAASADNNHLLSVKNIPQGGPLNNNQRIFIRGYLYLPTDIQWLGASGTLQHKYWYFKSTNYGVGGDVGWGWAFGAFTASGKANLRFSGGTHGGGTPYTWDGFASLTAGKWHCLEFELKLSPTYGQDEFRIWVDGTLVKDVRNAALRSQSDVSANRYLGTIEIGRQVNRYKNDPFDVTWYWDDIVVDTQYIGPMNATLAKKPSSPVLTVD